MNIIPVCVISIFTVICAVSLRKYSGEIASLLLVAAVILTAVFAIPCAQSIISSIEGFSAAASVREEYVQALVKTVGICYLTQLTADICRENGGQSAAAQAEICGRLAVLLIACPLYADLINVVAGFVE